MIFYTSDLNKTKKELMTHYGFADFNLEHIALGQRISLKGKNAMYTLRVKQLKDPDEYMIEIN